VKVKIANVRTMPPVDQWRPWEVYVGRWNFYRGLPESPLGNPFRGEDAILCFRAWLRVAVQGCKAGRKTMRPEAVAAYEELQRLRALGKEHGRLTLVCWCFPKPCHSEEIKRQLEEFDG
jgi:hypothetical protein